MNKQSINLTLEEAYAEVRLGRTSFNKYYRPHLKIIELSKSCKRVRRDELERVTKLLEEQSGNEQCENIEHQESIGVKRKTAVTGKSERNTSVSKSPDLATLLAK